MWILERFAILRGGFTGDIYRERSAQYMMGVLQQSRPIAAQVRDVSGPEELKTLSKRNILSLTLNVEMVSDSRSQSGSWFHRRGAWELKVLPPALLWIWQGANAEKLRAVICSLLLVPVRTRAAASWTNWRLFTDLLGRPDNRELHWSSLENEFLSCLLRQDSPNVHNIVQVEECCPIGLSYICYIEGVLGDSRYTREQLLTSLGIHDENYWVVESGRV